jgi:hypothetical protein
MCAKIKEEGIVLLSRIGFYASVLSFLIYFISSYVGIIYPFKLELFLFPFLLGGFLVIVAVFLTKQPVEFYYYSKSSLSKPVHKSYVTNSGDRNYWLNKLALIICIFIVYATIAFLIYYTFNHFN